MEPHNLARFPLPARQSDAEAERWNEYDALQSRRRELAEVVRKLVKAYPLLNSPAAIDAAIQFIEMAEDEITKRMSALDDASFSGDD